MNYIANTKGLGEKCHVSRGALCMHKEFKKMDPTYYKAYIAYMKAFRGAIYMENEECVKNVINKAYWDSMAQVNEEEESSEDHAMRYYILAASIVLVFVVALVLFHCYYKSQPTEGEGEDGGEDTLKISSSTKNP